jgi:hypothetical protein
MAEPPMNCSNRRLQSSTVGLGTWQSLDHVGAGFLIKTGMSWKPRCSYFTLGKGLINAHLD